MSELTNDKELVSHLIRSEVGFGLLESLEITLPPNKHLTGFVKAKLDIASRRD